MVWKTSSRDASGQPKNRRSGLRRETEGGYQWPYLLLRSVSMWLFPRVFFQELLTMLSLIREEQQRLKGRRSSLGPIVRT